ncbi:hypothetical protein Tco_0407912 [Tanacetum coccineum]
MELRSENRNCNNRFKELGEGFPYATESEKLSPLAILLIPCEFSALTPCIAWTFAVKHQSYDVFRVEGLSLFDRAYTNMHGRRASEVELKDLTPHLEYAFLEDEQQVKVIIAKELSLGEKADLIKVLKSQSEPSLGNYPTFRVNPNITMSSRMEVEKLLDAGLIFTNLR